MDTGPDPVCGPIVSGVGEDRNDGDGTYGRMRETTVTITRDQLAEYTFLALLYEDDYFPDHVLDKGTAVLRALCERIEAEKPEDLTALYALTAAPTRAFNDLEAEFEAAGSEIETVAREEIGEAFWIIATAYGFTDADPEKLIAEREW